MISEASHNKFAMWAPAIDRRFYWVIITDVYFGNKCDGWAVTDDFGNLVLVRM